MKKIYSFAMMLIAGAFAFTSCSDDNDSNPSLIQPSAFQINSTDVSAVAVDLENSQEFLLTWSLPTYTDKGAPVVPTFVVQASPSGSFTKEYDFESKENDGADYFTINQTFNGTKGGINAELLNQELQAFLGWSKAEDVPLTLPLTLRVVASVRDASFNDHNPIVSSNTITVTTAPYFILSVDPTVWYLVGANIGHANWNADGVGAGKGLVPLLPSGDQEYDKATGTGVISYTGFFLAGTQFKLIQVVGSWDVQANYTNVKEPDSSLITDEDGDNHNIGIQADGYYTVSLDTKKVELTIEKYGKNVTAYATMFMPGDQNGWGFDSNQMEACESTNGENHVWTAQFNVTGEGGVKFSSDSSWAANWGAETFPYGTGIGGGSNIPYVEGSYTVFFNDITGQYMFVKNAEE